MSDLHYQRKVTCPALPAIHLHREALVNRLKDVADQPIAGIEGKTSPYKLVLLHAPAGYGKTTLLVDFSRHTNLPCCWYFLDQTDTDRVTFLTMLLISIRQRFPDFGRELDPLLLGASSEHANNPTSINYFESVTDTLVRAMETDIHERFALFICNYQEINEFQEMNDLIGYLLQNLPPQCVLFIESRIIPDLDFAQLLAGQMILGMGINLLRFTDQQIHALARLQGVGPLTDSEVEHLAHTFNGWIAGILLGTRLGNVQLIQGESLFVEGSERQISSQYLFSYVVNEVFKSHQASYSFLKDTSILQGMTPAICAALLDISPLEAYAHLLSLEQNSLFVTHSGEGSEAVYTCTPVLGKLFYEQLRHETPERFSQLHLRAAELLGASNNYGQAVYHALEAGDGNIAASLIIESSEQMMNQGHAETLARWIDAFPAAITNRYPKLLLIRANIHLRQGNYNLALPLLNAADVIVEASARDASYVDKHDLPALRTEIAISRSKILFQQVEYRQSRLLCQQVLVGLPADEVTLRAEAYMRLGLCHILLGDFTSGIAQIQKALQLWGRHTVQRQTADGHSSLASAYSLLGNFALAEHHISRSIVCWDQLQDIWGKIDTLVSLAYIKLRQGAFEKAEEASQEALALSRGPIRFLRGRAYALVCLGEIYLGQDRYDLALEITEEALALARQISDQYLISGTLCNLAMIYLYMGDTATAMLLISEVEVQSTSGETVGYKHAIRDLAYGTIYLYQGPHEQAWPYLSRSEAILSSIGLKQEHLQVLLRLAAYHLTENRLADVIRCVEGAAAIATICEGYERLAQREIRHLPSLQQAIKTHPEMAHLRALLHMETQYYDTQPPKESRPVAKEEPQPTPGPVSTPAPTPEIETVRSKLLIHALGEPAVYIHRELVTRWRMARAMELFLYLLDCDRPMRKESIISALWPEMDEQTTRTFYSTIYYLRQALGGESVIVAKGGTYALKLSALYGDDIWYDIAAFEDHHAKARQALADEREADAKKSFQVMIDLYRGDYVQSFFSDWCTMRRDELRSAYLEARHQLALIYWHEENLEECIVHWQHMLAVDNSFEEAHYGLMRCYARQGKRGLALRQYQRCKDIMEQEFGTVPRAAIQNFYQRLMGSA